MNCKRYAIALVLVDESSSSSSSSEDELNDEIMDILLRKLWKKRRSEVTRIKSFLEKVVVKFTAIEFQSHFRMDQATFNHILKEIHKPLSKESGTGRNTIEPRKQFLATLWLLATPDSFRSVSLRFDMGKSSLYVSFFRVIKALNSIAPKVIKWPDQQERRTGAIKFQPMGNISGIVGAINGTYVPIKAPPDNPQVYVNRKCFHGVTLQALCNADLKYLDCFAGYPSSVSDCRIFRNSDFYQSVTRNVDLFFDDKQFILGDKAYPVLLWCIPPYIERGHVSQMQKNFNHHHAQSRQVIERYFSLLFGRFRRLRYLDMNRVDFIPSTIIACCVLHNLCLMDSEDVKKIFESEGTIYLLERAQAEAEALAQATAQAQAATEPQNQLEEELEIEAVEFEQAPTQMTAKALRDNIAREIFTHNSVHCRQQSSSAQ